MLGNLDLFRHKVIYFCLFLLLPLFSCTKELDIDLPEQKSLVLNSIFNPDSVFSFRLSYTTSPFAEYNEMDDTFHLKLYEGDYLLIDTDVVGGIYRSYLRPSRYSKYTIEVTTSGLPSVYAADSIPERVAIDDAFLIFPAGLDSYGDYVGEANITFTDPPENTNYYELLIYGATEYKSYWDWDGDYEIDDPVLLNEGDFNYFPTSLFFSDALFDGEECTIKAKGHGGYYYEGFKASTTYATLRSISKNYYLYRKYYTRHAYNRQVQGDFLDLIYKGEPQTMFTNIENGYGIFAGYQESTKKLYHKE